MSLQISHTYAEGTLLLGTSRGDGTADIAKANGYRWSRTIGCWYVQGSRDRAAKPWQMDPLADALRAAGHTVDVTIDDTPRPTEAVEQDRAERTEARVDRLTERSRRRTAAGAAKFASGAERLDRIPFGQPILIGHHSEGRDRRFRARAVAAMEKGADLQREGAAAARRAAAADANLRHRTDPRVTQRRIERLETDLRKLQRAAADSTPGPRLAGQIAHLEEQVAYWRAQLAAAVEADEYRPWGPEHFRKGDLARVLGQWRVVVRVNAKSLSLETGYSWTHPCTYDKIAGRHRDGEKIDQPPRVD